MNHLEGLKLDSFDALNGYDREERETFEAFKKRVKTELKDVGASNVDACTLRRFLDADRSKKVFKMDASLQRLKDALCWRKENGVDLMRTNKPKSLGAYEKLRVRQFFGKDKFNRPVQFERLGEFFNTGNASCRVLSVKEWERCYAWDIENIFREMRKNSKLSRKAVTQYVFVGDLGAFSFMCAGDFMKHGLPLLKKLSGEIERFYPECAGPIVLINAPYVVYSMYQLVKVFLDPVTAAKIEMHSDVPLKRLVELGIPMEAIPKELGGKSTTRYRHCVPYGEILSEQKADSGDDE